MQDVSQALAFRRHSLVLHCAILLLWTAVATTSLFAASPKITYVATPTVLAMFSKIYTPAYPYEARRSYMDGRGVFRTYIDANGLVTRIGVMKSTGYKLLDVNASYGLMHWKAKPGHPREVDMPVAFSLLR